MVEAYWNIGKSIVEQQEGYEKAEYGTRLIAELSKQMTIDFGKVFTPTNLKYMRQFYIEQAVKSNWSSRQLERQINSFFYERLLSSQNKKEVSEEIQKLEPVKVRVCGIVWRK